MSPGRRAALPSSRDAGVAEFAMKGDAIVARRAASDTRSMTRPGILSAALLVLAATVVVPAAQAQRTLTPDPPKRCDDCDAWNAPHEPFKLFGNTYYVGTAGLSALLVATDNGLLLFDGGLQQSAAVIDRNIRALGFRTEDIRYIFNSHAHYDHAGGINALQRVSGARVVASALGAEGLKRGASLDDDPQLGFGREAMAFPAVSNLQVVNDKGTVTLGGTTVTAHLTPGHTSGAMTWSWQACEGSRCVNVVYVDSLSAVAAPGFTFSTRPALVDAFKRSFATIAALPCDIVIAPHPGSTDLDGKLSKRKGSAMADPFIDPNGCRAFAEAATKRLEARLQDEVKKK